MSALRREKNKKGRLEIKTEKDRERETNTSSGDGFWFWNVWIVSPTAYSNGTWKQKYWKFENKLKIFMKKWKNREIEKWQNCKAEWWWNRKMVR